MRQYATGQKYHGMDFRKAGKYYGEYSDRSGGAYSAAYSGGYSAGRR
jgi:hypothetical protein